MAELVAFLIYKGKVENIKEFAYTIGTHGASITRWKKGEGYPSLEDIGNTIDSYGVNPVWLLTGKGSMFGKGMKEDVKQVAGMLSKMVKQAKSVR